MKKNTQKMTMMTKNILRINITDVQNPKNEVDYFYSILRVLRKHYPLGYMELPTICHLFYGEDRAKSILDRLKAAKVETEVPIIIHWEEGEANIIYNKLILPLSFITRTSESISLVNYNKAYSRFIETMEEGT